MNKLNKPKQEVLTRKEKNKRLFLNVPIWKLLLRMSIPGLIMMFVTGSYFFIDLLISTNLAGDKYTGYLPGKTGKEAVRFFMQAFAPLNGLFVAISMMFGMGTATRVSINMGRGDIERANNTIRTGFTMGMIISLIMIPIMIFVAKPWMEQQYSPTISAIVGKESFHYAWIIIMIFPVTFLMQIFGQLLRVEARNKQLMVATFLPVLVNLFFDWVFMGPLKMGIEGGAWATAIASFTTLAILVIFIKQSDSEVINFKTMIGLKFKIISIIGIILVGLAPFLRNFAQAVAQTATMSVFKDVSLKVYPNDPNRMTSIMTAVLPVFNLFFPMMFGFTQAAKPVASFNFGAQRHDRVKQVFMWVAIYATISGIIFYFLSAFALGGILMKWLGVSSQNLGESKHVLKILMLSIALFGLAVAGMVTFASTDRIILAIIATALRGFILIWPFIYGFKALAIAHPTNQLLMWWFFPALAGAVAIAIFFGAIYVLFLNKSKPLTLEERIERIRKIVSRKSKSK